MQADTGASVDVNDDGVVTIFGETQSIMLAALEIIEGIIEDPELDKIYEGKVVKLLTLELLLIFFLAKMVCFMYLKFLLNV